MLAANALKAGDGALYVTGGMESMSNAPYLDMTARSGARFGHVELRDSLIHDGLWCSMQNWMMGNAAEFIANQMEVSREEMDDFALRSHQKAAQATDSAVLRVRTNQADFGDVAVEHERPVLDSRPELLDESE